MSGSGLMHESVERCDVRANGLRFATWSCGEGERLALCLHGFPESSLSWRFQLPLLASLGYRAWAPDLRGFGDSDRPVGREHYAIEHLLDDVAGLIDASGARSVLLLGHDWGGVIAWYFALRQLRPLERLVVMNLPHPACMREVIDSGWRQRARSWYAFLFQLPWLPEKLMSARDARAVRDGFRRMALDPTNFGDEVLDHYAHNALQPGALTAMIDYYRALIGGGGAARMHSLGYPQIEVPTLLLWGEEDRALGKETTLGTDRFVRDLTLRYLPGVSHWVQQEAPETVNAMLEAWLLGKEVPLAGPDGRI